MNLLKRILAAILPQRPAKPKGYGPEVMFSGWVELPAELRTAQVRSPTPKR